MRAIRLLGRLVDAEDANLTALDAQEADAKRAMVDPPSLEAARQAGQDLDDVKAERAAAVPRVVTLANTCDRITRGLRHTAALQSRLISGRLFRPLPPFPPAPGASSPEPHPAPRPPRDPGREPAERPDFYDASERFDSERFDSERLKPGIDGVAMTDDQALRVIGRDLAATATAFTLLDPDADAPAAQRRKHRQKEAPSAYHYRPGETRPFPDLTTPATRPRIPDT